MKREVIYLEQIELCNQSDQTVKIGPFLNFGTKNFIISTTTWHCWLRCQTQMSKVKILLYLGYTSANYDLGLF